MFTLLTGPGYDADGDLSWGAPWTDEGDDIDPHHQGISTDMRPEYPQDGAWRIQVFFANYNTNERKRAT